MPFDTPTIQLMVTSIIATMAISSFFYNVIHNRRIAKLKKSNETLEKSIKYNGRHNPNYVYTIDRQVKEFYLDVFGNAIIQSLWEGLKPMQDFTNLKIPYSFRAEGDQVGLKAPKVKELDNSKYSVAITDLIFRTDSKSYAEYSGNFTVFGHFTKLNSLIGFKSTQEVEKGYCTTKEQAELRYRGSDWLSEYCASKVMVPMKELVLMVNFPYKIGELSGKPVAVCFISGTHTIHKSETEIIRKNFKIEFDRKAILTIEDPTPGLTYAISWMPPDKTTYQRISEKNPLSIFKDYEKFLSRETL